uniref:Arginine vasopressin-induced protein 1 n=1 Tax=Scleropages formosus TaxID=113540 RepID=A0A8C9VEH8_SCLFO
MLQSGLDENMPFVCPSARLNNCAWNCRGRRCGSPNIFQGVGVRQLRRLFRLSGDGKASRRAQLVWSHSDGKQLARALVTLRAQSRRGHPRPPKWLRAFNHLR